MQLDLFLSTVTVDRFASGRPARSPVGRPRKHVDPRDHKWERDAPFKNDYTCQCGAKAWRVGRSWRVRKTGKGRADRGD